MENTMTFDRAEDAPITVGINWGVPVGMEFAEVDCSGVDDSLSEIDVNDLVPDLGSDVAGVYLGNRQPYAPITSPINPPPSIQTHIKQKLSTFVKNRQNSKVPRIQDLQSSSPIAPKKPQLAMVFHPMLTGFSGCSVVDNSKNNCGPQAYSYVPYTPLSHRQRTRPPSVAENFITSTFCPPPTKENVATRGKRRVVLRATKTYSTYRKSID
ncbi:hypothetical protein Fcan01_10449 [Folsomia candida]|uniref:Uncharacterized protein n=1 Tax=Folsomia candida TaxID=158441 RepID=A0A226ECI6_FOLCA|nr:hypothetical protein Fcan01_10449 [Folsomia candida]